MFVESLEETERVYIIKRREKERVRRVRLIFLKIKRLKRENGMRENRERCR